MPRIVIENPLGTVGEGLAAGSDLVRREREHQARMKAFEADLEQASARTRMAQEQMQWERDDRSRAEQARGGLRDLTQTLQGLSPEQQEMFSRLDEKNLPLALQMVEADREQKELSEHRRMLEVETLAATSDPEYPVDAQMAQSVALQYADSPAEGRAALKQLRARQRHITMQMQQRSFARAEVSTLMATFPEAFRKAMPGTSPTAQQELIEDLLDELDDDPLEPDAGQKDYLGALAELRVLADPTLVGAHRRMEARYRADFEAATRALVPNDAAGPRVPIGVQDLGSEEEIQVQQAIAGANEAVPAAAGGSAPERDAANVVGGGVDSRGQGWLDELGDKEKPRSPQEEAERGARIKGRAEREAMQSLASGLMKRKEDGDELTERMIKTTQRRMQAQGIDVPRETIEAMYNGTWDPEQPAKAQEDQPDKPDRSGAIEAAARALGSNGLSKDRAMDSVELRRLGIELTSEEWREARKVAIEKEYYKQ